MSESSPTQLEFSNAGRRRMVGNFAGGDLSSDGGLALLRETDRLIDLLPRAAACFADHRHPAYVTHSVLDLVRQRVYGLCAGYEDLIDHERLRTDPLLALLTGRTDGSALGSAATLCRLENSRPDRARQDRYRRIAASFPGLDRLLVNVFLESHPAPPERIILDVDATDIKLHGKQERRFYHGFYDSYCYLPLYVTCGEHLLLCRLRPSNIAPATDAVAEIAPLIGRIRSAWPGTRILVRGDADFGRDPIMSFCEREGIDFVLGLARNPRLERRIARLLERSRRRCLGSGKPSRRFKGFRHQTIAGTWTRPRRVVGKAEYLPRHTGRDGAPRPPRPNARFVVTSLPRKQVSGRDLYELEYCPRGDCENRIFEQLQLFADRASASRFDANQLSNCLDCQIRKGRIERGCGGEQGGDPAAVIAR